MQAPVSSFLDAWRIFAALVVFIGHASGRNWTGGLLWQFHAYGDTAVVVFFVLSGYVMAHVSAQREKTWQQYAISRVARLWSVLIPALLLTAIIDALGAHFAPQLYLERPWYLGDKLVWRYLASFFLVHEFWGLELRPGINIPIWSLGYEVVYYAAFAGLWYARGRWRVAIVLGVLLAAGPGIACLFPIWLLGVALYHWPASLRPPVLVAGLALVLGLLGLLLAPPLKQLLAQSLADPVLLTVHRTITGLCFGLHLLGYAALSRGWTAFPTAWGHRLSRWAAPTFALYLMHRPLIQLFSVFGPDDATSLLRRVLVLAGTLAVVALLSPWCDELKSQIAARLRSRWPAGQRQQPGLA